MRYVYNDLGEVSAYPKERVTRALQLHMGDHVAFPRRMDHADFIKYWHHAIVMAVDYYNEAIVIIHFQPAYETIRGKQKPLNKLVDKGDVVHTPLLLTDEEVFRVEHDPDTCFESYEVVQRALTRLGETDYNLLSNNCEEFAHWCKTGRRLSEQVRTAAKVTGHVVASVKAKVASKVFMEKVLRLGKTAGRNGGRLTKVNGLFALVGAVVTAAFVSSDLAEAKRMRKAGKLSKREFENTVGTRLAVAIGDFSGSVAGTAIGSVVAGPVGALLGGAVGGAIGTVLGSTAGKVGVEVVAERDRQVETHAVSHTRI